MANTNVTMRIDENLKSQLQELMSDLGLDMTTFFTMAAKQAVREQGIPFYVSREIPNEETIAAFNEVEEMKKNPEAYKAYFNAEDMVADILHEI